MIASHITIVRAEIHRHHIEAVGRSEAEALKLLQEGWDSLRDEQQRPRTVISRAFCNFTTYQIGQVYDHAPGGRRSLLRVEDPHADKVECACCADPFDPHNEEHVVIKEHWVCSTCIDNNGTAELADKLGVEYEDACEAFGCEP